MVIVFLGMIEIEKAEVLLAMLELIFVLIAEMFSEIQLNMFFFDLLIPKVKPVSTGIFYRPPNVNTLLLNDKFILKENQSLDVRKLSSPLVSKYKELCQTFSLKEIIQEPTCITSNTSSLLDHILTNAGRKISQKGVIDVRLSDH